MLNQESQAFKNGQIQTCSMFDTKVRHELPSGPFSKDSSVGSVLPRPFSALSKIGRGERLRRKSSAYEADKETVHGLGHLRLLEQLHPC